MPSYRIGYGNDEQAIREIYHHVDVDREDGWTRPGKPAWTLVPR